MTGLRVRAMRAGEREAFLDLAEAAFDERDIFVRYMDEDAGLRDEDTLIAFDGPRPVAALQLFTRRIRLRGETVLLGGIGTVCTHPEFERRGISTRVLRTAIDEMTRRGMAISLLFSEKTRFYARLDWVQIPYPVWAVHARSAQDRSGRPYAPGDLPAVCRLYDAYTRDLELVTVRDEAYWRGQLACAGAPDEHFRVVERSGAVVGYARAIDTWGIRRVMEYAVLRGAEDALAELMVSLSPADTPLFVTQTPNEALAAELRKRAARVDRPSFPERMWRVIDRPRLLALAELGPDAADEQILRSLVATERGVFWPSDRF